MVHRLLRRFSMLVVAVFMAATVTSAQSGTGWEYDESTKTLTLSGDEVDWSGFADYPYHVKVENVVFTKTFNVSEIPSLAFNGFILIREIEIPDCVTSIGGRAFDCCVALTSINLPEKLQSIGSMAFEWCNSLTSVSLPASLNRIGDRAFYGCERLKVVKVLSDGTSENKHCMLLGDSDDKTTTGEDVFPKGQTTLVYDEDKTWIGDSDTENLRYYFDNFVTSSAVTNKGWKYDDTTKTLTLSGDEVAWHEFAEYAPNAEKVVFDKSFSVGAIDRDAFSYFTELVEIEIPACVTSIGERAFNECKSLASVSLHDGLQSIGDGAFSWCESLTSFSFPEELKSIGNGAFYRCESLTSISLPEELHNIGDWAFENSSSLTSVSLPASLNRIGDRAFDGCERLKVVKVLSDGTSENKHCILLGDSDDKSATGKYVFPKGHATLVYDEDKTWIGDSDTENLRAYFENFVTSTAITNKGWKYDADTKTLTLSGDEVAWYEFADYAPTAEKVVFDKTFDVATIGYGAFSCFTKLTEIEIPDCVTSIGEKAFYHCESLISVELLEGLQSIGSYAFRFCSSLNSITLPKGLESIRDYAFYNCSLTSVSLPDGLESIGNYAFCYYLTSVSLPATLKYIGDKAFGDCYKLETVIIKSDGTSDKKHYVLLGEDNEDDKAATGNGVFPCQATLVYDPNTTWIGDDNTQNLLYYFDGKTQETALDVTSVKSAPAQYYDLGGRRVNVGNYRGVVVKVEDGKSELMMLK